MFVTKKKMKKMKTEMMCVAGAGCVFGATGTVLSTVSLVKGNKHNKKTEESIADISRHVASLENTLTKYCKATSVMQNALLEHGMIAKN